MGLAGLSLHRAPPIWVPLRFFLTAPIFACAAGMLMIVDGPAVFASRWRPETLALVHLLTLGFMAMVMAGALLQLLPVLAGSPVPRPRLAAGLVHFPLAVGAVLLPVGLLNGNRLLIVGGSALLVWALTFLVVVSLASLLRAPVRHGTVGAMALALLALAVTVGLGTALAWRLAGYGSFDTMGAVNLHAAWALAGWVGLLLAGVAFQVVPMFQLTPQYPRSMVRLLAPVTIAVLVTLTIASWRGEDGILQGGSLGLAAGYAWFSVTTWQLQGRRRRKVPDVTLKFWRLAMGCLLLTALLMVAGSGTRAGGAHAYALWLGTLLLEGVAISAITGMLYKIVPFLVWFHLQREGRTPPHMKAIIPDGAANRQFILHALTLPWLLGAPFLPALAYLAGAFMTLSAGMLAANLITAARLYQAGQGAIMPFRT